MTTTLQADAESNEAYIKAMDTQERYGTKKALLHGFTAFSATPSQTAIDGSPHGQRRRIPSLPH